MLSKAFKGMEDTIQAHFFVSIELGHQSSLVNLTLSHVNPLSPENHAHTHIISSPNSKIAILLRINGISIMNKNIASLIQQILNKNNKVILKTTLTTSLAVKNNEEAS